MTPRPYTCGQWLRDTGAHCGLQARLYPAGWLCDDHSPANQPSRPAPFAPPKTARASSPQQQGAAS